MKNRISFKYLILLFLPVLLVFRNLFLPGDLVWGDAPYFYPEAMKFWTMSPYAWTNIGANLGGINFVVWLGPLMRVYGFLGNILKLNNDLIIRILFYLPALASSLVGPYLITKYLKLSKVVSFFTTLIYVLNTYFLLLIDGGQVGVALAYGLFPTVLFFLRQVFDSPSFKNIFFGFLSIFILTLVDPRITLVSFVTLFLWIFVEFFIGVRKKIFNYLAVLLIVILLLPVNLFWISPLFQIGGLNLSLQVSNLKFLSLLNSLTLFNPHWPDNIYGVVNQPFWYFILFPFLVFSNLFFKQNDKRNIIFIILFLLFAFLSKGETSPFGQIYSFLLYKIPLGSIFRDSTKFFVPLILFSGILYGLALEKLSLIVKGNKLLFSCIFVFGYFYILLLVQPAIFSKLNFVLSNRSHSTEYQIIYQNLNKETSGFSTLWFPERHPLSFQTDTKTLVDAKSLTDLRPFASLNIGTFDKFNFLHNKQTEEWIELFGIKYLIFSNDPRKVSLNAEESNNWEKLLYLAQDLPFLKRTNWNIAIPVYEISDPKPKVFGVEKLLAVVGPDDVYNKIEKKVWNYATVFVEDGIFDSSLIKNFPKDSVELVFNGKKQEDLTFSSLKEFFLKNQENIVGNWAYFPSSDYLLWKYQLLIRGIDSREFDYRNGIYMSTLSGEKLLIDVDVVEHGDYVIAVRSMNGNENSSLDMQIDEKIIPIQNQTGNFSWFVVPLSLAKDQLNISLINKGGVSIVNTVALIPKSEYMKSLELTSQILEKYKAHKRITTETSLGNYEEIEFTKKNPVEYSVTKSNQSKANWLVFTDNYHQLWEVECEDKKRSSLPIYSSVNGFFIGDCLGEINLRFSGQKYIDVYKKVALVTFLALIMSYLGYAIYKKYSKTFEL